MERPKDQKKTQGELSMGNQNTDRRGLLKFGAVAAGTILASAFATAAPVCRRTPEQTSGPFYPGESEFAPINDLTRLPGAPRVAEGQVILLKGSVVDQNCRPLSDANVEIWQACASGKYNNPRDPNPAPLDPYFRYWGEYDTESDGSFWFRTVVPGAYPADDDWTRPPHIHVRVTKLGYRELVTQMYFKGHPLNELDRVLRGTPAGDRSRLEVDFVPLEGDSQVLTGNFNMTLVEL